MKFAADIDESTDVEVGLAEVRGFAEWYILVGYQIDNIIFEKVKADSDNSVDALQNPENIVQEIVEKLKIIQK